MKTVTYINDTIYLNHSENPNYQAKSKRCKFRKKDKEQSN